MNSSSVEPFPTFLVEQQNTPQLFEGAAYTFSHALGSKDHRIKTQANKSNFTVVTLFFEDMIMLMLLYSHFPSFSEAVGYLRGKNIMTTFRIVPGSS